MIKFNYQFDHHIKSNFQCLQFLFFNYYFLFFSIIILNTIVGIIIAANSYTFCLHQVCCFFYLLFFQFDDVINNNLVCLFVHFLLIQGERETRVRKKDLKFFFSKTSFSAFNLRIIFFFDLFVLFILFLSQCVFSLFLKL